MVDISRSSFVFDRVEKYLEVIDATLQRMVIGGSSATIGVIAFSEDAVTVVPFSEGDDKAKLLELLAYPDYYPNGAVRPATGNLAWAVKQGWYRMGIHVGETGYFNALEDAGAMLTDPSIARISAPKAIFFFTDGLPAESFSRELTEIGCATTRHTYDRGAEVACFYSALERGVHGLGWQKSYPIYPVGFDDGNYTWPIEAPNLPADTSASDIWSNLRKWVDPRLYIPIGVTWISMQTSLYCGAFNSKPAMQESTQLVVTASAAVSFAAALQYFAAALLKAAGVLAHDDSRDDDGDTADVTIRSRHITQAIGVEPTLTQLLGAAPSIFAAPHDSASYLQVREVHIEQIGRMVDSTMHIAPDAMQSTRRFVSMAFERALLATVLEIQSIGRTPNRHHGAITDVEVVAGLRNLLGAELAAAPAAVSAQAVRALRSDYDSSIHGNPSDFVDARTMALLACGGGSGLGRPLVAGGKVR